MDTLSNDKLLFTISVHLINHILEFCLCRILPQGSHHRPQLFGGYRAIPVLIEEAKGLLELCDLLFR
jgi:hypothetical protein